MSGVLRCILHNVAAIRSEPDAGSELISQVILGDAVSILGEFEAYVRVRCRDGYEGWILASMLGERCAEADGPVAADLQPDAAVTVKTAFADVLDEAGQLQTRIVFGTPVYVHGLSSDTVLAQISLPDGRRGLVAAAALAAPGGWSGGTSELPGVARRFLGTPYLWGGTTPFGFDCSGLVQRVYTTIGVTLPRDAYLQAQSPLGRMIEPSEERSAGDLIFFLGSRDPRNRGITHVGIAVDSTAFIHAYGKTGVTIDSMESEEISRAYSYRGAWRLTSGLVRPNWV